MEINEEKGTKKSRVEKRTRGGPSQHANTTTAKMNPFSIEAILAAPHPKKERRIKTNQRRSTQSQNQSDVNSALSTLETFASKILNNSGKDEVLESEKFAEESSESGMSLVSVAIVVILLVV